MNFLALDSAILGGFGVCRVTSQEGQAALVELVTLKTKLVGPARLKWFRDWFIEEIAAGVDVIAIEGYAFSMFAGRTIPGKPGQPMMKIGPSPTSITGLVGIGELFRLAAWERNQTMHEISPTMLKKWATGSGLAKKTGKGLVTDDVWVAAQQHPAAAALVRDNNQADAFWMGHMMATWNRVEMGDLPLSTLLQKKRREVLKELDKGNSLEWTKQ
jgi:hypothetical protein